MSTPLQQLHTSRSDGPAPPLRCESQGCSGYVTRHSLGCGQSVYRCSRCFHRYGQYEEEPRRGRVREMINEFVTWREDAD